VALCALAAFLFGESWTDFVTGVDALLLCGARRYAAQQRVAGGIELGINDLRGGR